MTQQSFVILKWKADGIEDHVRTFIIRKQDEHVSVTDEKESNTYSIKFYNFDQFELQVQMVWTNLIRTHSDCIADKHIELMDKEITLSCVWATDREKGIQMHMAERVRMRILTSVSLIESMIRKTTNMLTQATSPFLNISKSC